MKFLVLLFLAGFALASAVPLRSEDNDVDEQSLFGDIYLAADDGTIRWDDDEEAKEPFREPTELEMRVAIAWSLLRWKLNNLKNELTGKAKDMFEKINAKVKHYWKSIVDKFHAGKEVSRNEAIRWDDDEDEEWHEPTELEMRLAIAWAMLQWELNNFKDKVSGKASDLIDKINAKAKDYWRFIKEKFHSRKEVADNDHEGFKQKLTEKYEQLLEKLKDAFEHGKEIKDETIAKLIETSARLKELKVKLSDKAKTLYIKIREKVGNYWQRVLNDLRDKYADDSQKTSRALPFENKKSI